MERIDIIQIIGREFLVSNIENGEFSYPQAFKEYGIPFEGIEKSGSVNQFLDMRFTNGKITILVETKQDFRKGLKKAIDQLTSYVQYEKALTGNKIIAILANTNNDDIMVWRGAISDSNHLSEEYKLKSFREYADYYTTKTNDKEKIMRNTYALNELLNLHGIQERLRSQFVGTCLLTLKNSKARLLGEGMSTSMIRGEMKNILNALLDGDQNKKDKLELLSRNILDSQDIRDLPDASFQKILREIHDNILPFINDRSTAGQDLLNLFFVTFNKYVGKADKNQAFTPDHIADFMARVVEVNRYSKVLDPCCGSGSFLVRAMMQAMDDCSTETEQNLVKKCNIYGIEFDENVYGLATTNMLIHSDGNSNIRRGSCFDFAKDILGDSSIVHPGWNIDIVLMNPPYNGTRKTMPESYTKTWGDSTKQDPSKGMYFVKWVADTVRKGKLAVLLPMACAIGTTGEISRLKKELLREHTLDAVFSLPSEIFYPGASAMACCMIFSLGKRHDSSKPTFFGYYKEDGFTKKKNLGRVERVYQDGTGVWGEIENRWLDLYRSRGSIDGKSALHCVTGDDEWLAEAYMKTDYSKLSDDDFVLTRNAYLAYLIMNGRFSEFESFRGASRTVRMNLDISSWKEFRLGNLLDVQSGKGITKEEIEDHPGSFQAIQSGEENMGILGTIDREYCIQKEYTMTDEMCLTVARSGTSGYVSYHPDGCVVGDSAKMLVLKNNNAKNAYVYLFLRTILEANRYKYSYGRKVTNTGYRDTILKLPVIADGSPDWEYMEQYIKTLPF